MNTLGTEKYFITGMKTL